MKQAQRVEQEMNYLITQRMTEYRPELEQMLFMLPIAGSAFKKTYFDQLKIAPYPFMSRQKTLWHHMAPLIWKAAPLYARNEEV